MAGLDLNPTAYTQQQGAEEARFTIAHTTSGSRMLMKKTSDGKPAKQKEEGDKLPSAFPRATNAADLHQPS